MNKITFKQKLEGFLEDLTKTNFFVGVGSFFMLNIFLLIMFYVVAGFRADLFIDYFNLTVILLLSYIAYSVSNFSILSNGYLGLANGVYLATGIMALVTQNAQLLRAGLLYVDLIYGAVLIAFAYKYIVKPFWGWYKNRA